MLFIFLYIIVSVICLRSYANHKQINRIELIFILTILALIVGLGDMLGGYDRYVYGELFDRNADLIRNGGPFINLESPIMGYQSEISYVIWNSLVAYITPNRYIYILFTTLFIYILLFISFR